LILAVAVAGVVLAIAAFAVGVAVSDEDTPRGGRTEATTVTTVAEPTPEEIEGPTTTEPEPPAVLAFGRSATYDDDTQLQIVRVTSGSISEFAAGGSRARDRLVKVTVKITAGREAIDLAPEVKLQYGTGGRLPRRCSMRASTPCRMPPASCGRGAA
jgi:hypothetical protein